MKKILIILSFIIALIIIIQFGIYSYYIEPAMLNITRYKIKDEDLKGIKIVFPADFHLRPYQKERLNNIVKIINDENADLVLCIGDFVAGHTKNVTMQIEEIAEELSKVKSKYGFYTVLGNHDIWYGEKRIVEALSKNNIKVLDNENIKLNIDGKTVYIAGIEDMHTQKPDISKALANTSTPIIFLTHTPDMFPKTPSCVNLTLAGHTHGGQIDLPIIGTISTATKYFRKYAKGLIIENDKKMIVSKGIGVSIIPIRFNCIPEIVVIEFE